MEASQGNLVFDEWPQGVRMVLMNERKECGMSEEFKRGVISHIRINTEYTCNTFGAGPLCPFLFLRACRNVKRKMKQTA